MTHVLYLQDSTKRKTIFPPGFSTGFNKLPIGIVTKSDSAQADVNTAIRQLRNAVPKGPIVISSSISGKGIEEIRSLVKCHSFQEMKDYAESLPDDVVIFK